MSKAIEILEEKLVPVAAWVAENKYVNGIRRAFIMMMPLPVSYTHLTLPTNSRV